MGCWNKTCGLSGLHITAGSPVYVFVLEKNTYHDRCYATSFWHPVLLPFLSKYDDYGGGEDNHSNINYILDGIRKVLVEIPQGENRYHDIPVTKEAFNEKMFFESVHEGRLFVTGGYNGSCALDFVMMRVDVVDYICENYTMDMYVGDGKGTGGFGNNYKFYKFADIIAGIPEFLDKLANELAAEPEDKFEKTLPYKIQIKYALRGLSSLYDYKEHNLVATYLRSFEDHRYSSIVRPTDIVVTLMAKGKRKEAEALLADLLKASFIDSFLDSTRKQWIPGCHEGSQSQEVGSYRVLCDAINNALDVEKAYYDEE